MKLYYLPILEAAVTRVNRLNQQKRAQVIGALVEGNSLRSVVRMTSIAMNTILKALGRIWTDRDVERVRKYKQENYRKGRGRKSKLKS